MESTYLDFIIRDRKETEIACKQFFNSNFFTLEKILLRQKEILILYKKSFNNYNEKQYMKNLYLITNIMIMKLKELK